MRYQITLIILILYPAFLHSEKNMKDVNLNANERYNISIHDAAEKGDYDTVNELISDGVDVNKTIDSSKMTPLHIASKNGHIRIVNLLIEKGADVNARSIFNSTPLFYASEKRHLKICQLLITNGADVNIKNSINRTVLHQLSIYGPKHNRLEICKLLITNGADINARADSITPLHMAAFYHCLDICDYLIKKRVIIDSKDDSGRTALYYARKTGIAKLIINAGANINTKDKEGLTPLHIAVMLGDLRRARLLIDNGADIDIKNKKNKTPLDLAKEGGRAEIINLLNLYKTGK